MRHANAEALARYIEHQVLVRHIAGDDQRDFNRWMMDMNTPRVREYLVAFELADIQRRERGE